MSLLDELFAADARVAMIADVPARDIETSALLTLQARAESLELRIEKLGRQQAALLRDGARASLAVERQRLAERFRTLNAEAKGHQSQVRDMLGKLEVARRLFRVRMKLPRLQREGLWDLLADVRTAELDDVLNDMALKASQGDGRAKRLLEILEGTDPAGE